MVEEFNPVDMFRENPNSLRLFGDIYRDGSKMTKSQLQDRISSAYPDMDPQKLDNYLEPLKNKRLIIVEENTVYLTGHGLNLAETFEKSSGGSSYEIIAPDEDKKL